MQERGGRAWLALMVLLYRWGGRGLFFAVLVFVIAWYWLFAVQARRASVQYLRQLHAYAGANSPFKREPGAWQAYLHFLQFGHSALDKIAAWLGDLPADIDLYGHEHMRAAYGRGALILGSHLGNLEFLRAAKADHPQTVNVLVHTRHAEAFNRMLARLNPKASVRLTQVTDLGADGAIALQQKLEAGEWLLVAADRTPIQSRRTVSVDFLGRPAPFPEGGMRLGALLRCPILLVFCYRRGRRYEVHIHPFRERLILPRGARDSALQAAVSEYANTLQAHCLRVPYQWFNFFDFWARHDSE